MVFEIVDDAGTYSISEPLCMTDIVKALRFKAEHPKAKAPAEMWVAFAYHLDSIEEKVEDLWEKI